MIANCGAMGLDWRSLDLSDYLEALEAQNDGEQPEKKTASEQLMRFVKAHKAGDGGNGQDAGAVAKGEGAPGA